jgi:hypothetical protein
MHEHLGEVDNNDETVNAGNTAKFKKYASLEGLFDPPPPRRDSESSTTPTTPPEAKDETPDVIRAMRREVQDLPQLPPLAPGSNMSHRKLAPTSSMVTMAANNQSNPAAQQQPLSLLVAGKPSPLKHHHKRQVSWGVIDAPSPPRHESDSNSEGDGQGSVGLNSGSLLERTSLEDSLTALSISAGQSSSHHCRNQSRARIMSLDDILRASPLEQEAETFILKALDDLHPSPQQQRPRFDTATSTIFTQQPGSIPDSASHDFSLEDDEDNPNYTNQINHTDGLDLSASSSQDEDDEEENEEAAALNSSSNHSKRIQRSRLHRRSVSVEQRLLGLTSAMALQDVREEKEEANTGRRKKKNKSTNGRIPMTIGVRQYEPVSAEDEIAQNHTVLLSPSQLEGWIHEESALPTSPKMVGKQMPVRNLATVEEADEGIERQDTGDIEAGSSDGGSRRSGRSKPQRRRLFGGRKKKIFSAAKLKNDLDLWRAFLQARKQSLYDYLKSVFLFLMLPSTAVAAILFYFVENPTTGKSNDGDNASVSWWLLFLGVRQVITFSLALGIQSIVIDFLSLNSKVILKVFGPLLTLFLVQSKGWPFIFFCWSILDLCSLYGDGPFAAHWAFWQNLIDLFNDTNPSGNVVNSDWNKTILLIAVSVSLVVALKRFVVGVFLGRQTFGKSMYRG